MDLSPREFSLLECLLRHPGQTLTRDQLLDQAWPFGVAVTPNAVDAYIHYLRDKLGGCGPPDRDRPRRGLSARGCLTALGPTPISGRSPRSRPPSTGSSRASGVNLTLWSGGTTLPCCVVLGVVLYVAVDRSLTASGIGPADGSPRSA